jgi:hypothetical protein
MKKYGTFQDVPVATRVTQAVYVELMQEAEASYIGIGVLVRQVLCRYLDGKKKQENANG